MPTDKEKLIEISQMEVRSLGININCLDVGLIRRYGTVYRNDSGQRFNFCGAYKDDARDTIIFQFKV